MAFTINYNGTNYSLWSSSNKITTPSLIIDGSNYVPLASGNINDWVDIQGNGFQYQLSPLLVDGSKRAPYARRFVKNISGTLSGNITGTATTTTNTPHTVTGSVPINFGGNPDGSNRHYASGDWQYGVTFAASAPVHVNLNFIKSSSSNASLHTCGIESYDWKSACYSLVVDSNVSNVPWSLQGNINFSATGNITTTVGTSESKSITVSKNDSYGVTYPSTPSILNLSGASIQSRGTSSTTVAAVLTGTVNYGQTLTLTRAYSYTVLGAI